MAYSFTDNFTRANTAAGAVGNGWIDTANDWQILNNELHQVSNAQSFTQELLRPTGEAFKNGKIKIGFDFSALGTNDTGGIVISMRNQNNSGSGKRIGAYIFPNNGFGPAGYTFDGSSQNTMGQGSSKVPYVGFIEIVANETTMTCNIYGSDGTTVLSTDVFTVDSTYNVAGTVGISSWNGTHIKSFAIDNGANAATGVTISGSASGTKGSPIAFTVTSNGTLAANTSVALTSSGVSGTFANSTVTLPAGNQTSVNATFTPTATGNLTITATPTGLSASTFNSIVADIPFMLGLLGDSIYEQNNVPPAMQALLESYSANYRPIAINNQGKSSRTTRSFMPDGTPGNEAGLLTAAVASFNSSPVTSISFKLGTNDASVNSQITKAEYKSNVQTIVAYLFANIPTLKNVILQYPHAPTPSYSGTFWADSPTSGNTMIVQYHTALDEIVALATSAGKIFGGSKGSYFAFQNLPSLLPDGIHPGAGQAAEIQAMSEVNAVAAANGFGPDKASGSGGGSNTTAPTTPLSLTIFTDPTGKPVLNWTDDGGFGPYYVLRSTDRISFTRIATVSGRHTYIDYNPINGLAYYSVVSAHP